MKKIKKTLLLATLLVSAGVLASCGGNNASQNDNKSSGDNSGQKTDTGDNQGGENQGGENQGGEASKEVKLVGNYLTPAKLGYMNVRPQYNYYVTTYSYQHLQTFDNNQYVLTVVSNSYSALILPEEGNDATGNERANTIERYMGTYTSEVDELDEDTLNVTLSVPTRYTLSNDSQYYVDTANWDEAAKTHTAVKTGEGEDAATTVYETASDYLKTKAFVETTIPVTKATGQFDYTELQLNGSATASQEKVQTKDFFQSVGTFTYMNVRPTYNYYEITFKQETLELVDDSHYVFSLYSSCFSGLVLPEEGNDATGNERANYVLQFMGEYTAQDNDLDEDTLDITVKAPTRLVLQYDAAYSVDTANWDDAAKKATEVKTGEGEDEKVTQYATGEEYIATFGIKEFIIQGNKETKQFEFANVQTALR